MSPSPRFGESGLKKAHPTGDTEEESIDGSKARAYDYAFLAYFIKDASFFGDLARHLAESAGKKSILLSYSRLTDAYFREKKLDFYSMDEARSKVNMDDWDNGIAAIEKG